MRRWQRGLAHFGAIDALVNNAGYGAYGPLEAFSMDGIRRQFDTNVIGLLATTKAILPHMRAAKTGTIVNISSIGGKMTFPLGTLYHGSKFAVEGLSEALHYELEPLGVRVKIVEPGMIKTDFGGRSFDFQNDESLTDYQDAGRESLCRICRNAAMHGLRGKCRCRCHLAGGYRWLRSAALHRRCGCCGVDGQPQGVGRRNLHWRVENPVWALRFFCLAPIE
jgi:NAD(P)-dependent dehydrogenase (short-subunit alcohol dehydrogenase family)